MCQPRIASLKKDKEAAYGFNHEGEKAVSKEGMAILMEIGYGKKESIFLPLSAHKAYRQFVL